MIRDGVAVYLKPGGIPVWFDHDSVTQIVDDNDKRALVVTDAGYVGYDVVRALVAAEVEEGPLIRNWIQQLQIG